MIPDVFGKFAMTTTDQQRREESPSSVAMDRDDGVNVIDEIRQCRRMIGRHVDRRDVVLHPAWLVNSVVARPRSFGRGLSDDVGHLLEATTVVRHETDAPITRIIVTPEDADFLDIGVGEKFAEAGHLRRHDDDERP